MSIKYYQLAKDEELPEEFCAVRDVGGEPSEYVFYVPESEVAKLREDLEDQEGYDQMLRDRLRQQTELCVKAEAENARLHKLVQRMWPAFIGEKRATFADRLHVRAEIDELGVEVEQ